MFFFIVLAPGLDSTAILTAITCDIYPRTNKNDRKMGNLYLSWPKLLNTF